MKLVDGCDQMRPIRQMSFFFLAVYMFGHSLLRYAFFANRVVHPARCATLLVNRQTTSTLVIAVPWQKGLWAVLLLAMFAAMCVHIGTLLQRFLEHDTVSDITLNPHDALGFPGK